MLGLGGALAAAFTAKFSVASIRAAAEEMDKMAKMVDTLGASTERLSGLSRAADLSGSSFEGLTKGMTFMERTLSSDPEAFKTLGMDIEALRRTRPETVFLNSSARFVA